MPYEKPSTSYSSSNKPPTEDSIYNDYLSEVLEVRGYAELIGAFAHNTQANPDGSYLDGPIALDPTINISQLHELGLVYKDGVVITRLGKHVTQTVTLDSEQLADGCITPVMRRVDP